VNSEIYFEKLQKFAWYYRLRRY